MNTSTFKALSLLSFLSIAIILAFSFLLASSANAHNVVDANGQSTHSHVYKKSANGKGVVAGHSVRPAGSNGIVIWQSAPGLSNGNAQSGMSIPRDPWSKKNRKNNRKKASRNQTVKKKQPVFTKNQDRRPVLDPQ